MKVDIIRKFKWYIVGFIMVVIMLSVGLSFCTWDDLSINKALSTAKTGSYETTYKLVDDIYKDDSLTKGQNGIANVGDIVTFGRYWQDTDATGVDGLKPQRWIIVNIDSDNVATLLTEKVVVYGNFWGLDEEPFTRYQNYYQSTLRAWLNSGRDSVVGSGVDWIIGNLGAENLRDDTLLDNIGSAFNGDAEIQSNRGFLDVAFNSSEQSILVPKEISGIQGYGKNTDEGGIEVYATRNGKVSINDLVWVPSYREIYGDIKYYINVVLDGTPNEQFAYFKNSEVVKGESYNTIAATIASATDYAWNSYDTIASYYNNGAGGRNETQEATWWRLRSPRPARHHLSMIVHMDGHGHSAHMSDSFGGVRPAVCIRL